ncbi:MAG: hypothetical protein EP335_07860 [Alphaproteobacteria bacterium]|nr:MAG: hypothetical protein EP335_07860 [Alphaproteobacteria bacterium]
MSFLPLLLLATAACADDNPVRDSTNQYQVFRNGHRIGSHEIRFEQSCGTLHVRAETRMKVKLLFVTVYRYHYVSDEVWQAGRLKSVRTRVEDNGEIRTSQADLRDGQYLAHRAGGRVETLDGTFMTTNHWNADVARAASLFNTITGKLNRVSITPVPAGGETMLEVRGDLDIDSFYDDAGNWLGMRFRHTDGSLIEFRCTDCRNTPELPA